MPTFVPHDPDHLSAQLTPEREAAILAALGEAGTLTNGAVAARLDVNLPTAHGWLGLLAERGLVRQLPRPGLRPLWECVPQDLDPFLVREEHMPRILAWLEGRRELPGTVARALRLPLDEVAETCRALVQRGELVVTPVGQSFVYARVIRGRAWTDPDRPLPASPETHFRAQLAALPPEQPIRLTRGRPPGPPLLPLAQAAKKARLGLREARALIHRGRVRHEGIGEAARVDVADLTAYRRERRRPRAGSRARKRQARRVAQEAAPIPEGFQVASDVARRLGVQPTTFLKWLSTHDRERALCRRDGKYLLVPQAVVERYVQASLPVGATFAAEAPDGWLSIWEAVAALGWSYSKVYKMLAARRLVAVLAGGALRFDPEPLAALKADLDDQSTIPDGWVSLRALAEELNLDKSSVTSWMTRHTVEIRQYRDAARQIVNHVSTADADAYRAHRARHPGGRKTTPELVAAVQAELKALPPGRRHPPGAVQAVAGRHGISTTLVLMILRGESSAAQPPQAAD